MTAIPAPVNASGPERRVDPSMEDILASIRKIIADEESAPPRASTPAVARQEASAFPALKPTPVTPPQPIPRAIEELRRPASVTPISQAIPTPQPAPQVAAPSVWPTARSSVSPLAPSRLAVSQPAPPQALPPQALPPQAAPPQAEPHQAAPLQAEPHQAAPHAASKATAMDDDSPALDDARPFAEKASSPTSAEAPQGREPPAPHGEGGALVSATIKDSIATAFQALTASVALTSGETVDRHVRDLLRPMLRTWLDDNLPVIVEKLVRVEIERVARGGR